METIEIELHTQIKVIYFSAGWNCDFFNAETALRIRKVYQTLHQ